MGKSVLAVNAILFHFQAFLSFGLDGFAQATEILVGKSIGEKNYTRFSNIILTSSILAFATTLIYFLSYIIFIETIFSIFSDNQLLLEDLSKYKIWIILSPLISVFCFQLDGIYIGALQTKYMRNSMLFSFIFYILSLYVLVPIFKNHGIWLSFILFLMMRSITLSYYFPSLIRNSFKKE